MASQIDAIPSQCDVCCKTFCGPIPAGQHFRSAQHLKKVQNRQNSNRAFYCHVCNIACDTQAILDVHNESPRHNAMLEKQQQMHAQSVPQQIPEPKKDFRSHVPLTGNPLEDEDNLTREYVFDSKTQTGYCNYCEVPNINGSEFIKHLESKPHKKKVMEKRTDRYNNSSPVVQAKLDATTMCVTCQVPFTGTCPAKQHYSSQKHKQKVALAQEMDGQTSGATYQLESKTVSNNGQNTQFVAPIGANQPGILEHERMDLCTICQAPFTSPLNAQQHYASDKHKKKVARNQLINQYPSVNPEAANNAPMYSPNKNNFCDVCQVPFTGPENARQHYNGEKHLKTLKQREREEKSGIYPLRCDVCDCNFTGQATAEAHFVSKKHERNMQNKSIQDTQSISSFARPPISWVNNININRNDGDKEKVVKKDQTNESFDHADDSNDDDEDLHIKPIPPDDNESDHELVIKPIDVDPTNTEYAFHRTDFIANTEQEHSTDTPVSVELNIKPFESETLNGWDSNSLINNTDEEKIKSETLTSLTNALDEENADDDSSSFPPSYISSDQMSIGSSVQSERDNEPVRYVRNDLNGFQIPPVGRGKGFLQYTGGLLSKLVNLNKTAPTGHLDNVNTLEERMRNLSTAEHTDRKAIDTLDKETANRSNISNEYEDAVEEDDTSEESFELSNDVLQTKNIQRESFADSRYVNQGGVTGDNEIIYARRQGNSMSHRRTSNESAIPEEYERGQGHTLADRRTSNESANSEDYGRRQGHISTDRRTSTESDNVEEFTFSSVTNRGRCYVCNIELTSRNHMSQHISGGKHLKATVIWKQMLTSDTFENHPYVCKVCRVVFSGPEARQQHFQSQKHISKEQEFETGGLEYLCDVCKIQCSGAISFQQHILGAQHKKLSGFNTDQVAAPQLGIDQTVWYPCETCGCNMNTLEQLQIHLNSPRHQAKVRQVQGMPNVDINESTKFPVVSADQTVWYPCNVCKCQMNTIAQLQAHENSPKHLAKLQKANLMAPGTSSPGQRVIEQSHQSPSVYHATVPYDKPEQWRRTPLEMFTSIPLFPDESTQETGTEKEPLDSQEAIGYTGPRFALPQDIDSGIGSNEGNPGGAKRGQGSDLAWALRNKGTSTKTTSSNASATRNTFARDASGLQTIGTTETGMRQNPVASAFPDTGAIPKQTSDDAVNPYAATHHYYCHVCKSPMNTKESYESHIRGRRHMQKVSTEQVPSRDHLPARDMGRNFVPSTKTEPRNYQIELYQKAMASDTLCFLPTGTGKTLVAVMTISAMLDRYPSKNVLFLVDKVLLVLQQSSYILDELRQRHFRRWIPGDGTDQTTERRHPRIAAMCMDQQNTGGIPLWQHDVVVVTAAFCKNLLDKEILRWGDFSLVVFDEAHHCEKSHPFSVLLQTYHSRMYSEATRPKVLGLTASPAGKSDVNTTLMMLKSLILNMGGVRMCVVEQPENVKTLKEFQSNAEMIIKSQTKEVNVDSLESKLKQELNIYIFACYMKLVQVSNIKNYVDMGKDVNKKTPAKLIEDNIDMLQSSLNMLDSERSGGMDKVSFSFLTTHMQSICMALNGLHEGGILCALEEFEEMEKTGHNFLFAKSVKLPCDPVQVILSKCSKPSNGDEDGDFHIEQLIGELTASRASGSTSGKTISLVLVKERGTAHGITRILQNSAEMQRYGLHTTTVVGHGGGGSGEKGMSVNQQKRVLEDIKQYKYQVIIATSVAEEGVDWPQCERVISMYPPTNVTALVQMRGRARKKNSKFIVLCASKQQEDKLVDIMNREQNMITATRMLLQQTANDE